MPKIHKFTNSARHITAGRAVQAVNSSQLLTGSLAVNAQVARTRGAAAAVEGVMGSVGGSQCQWAAVADSGDGTGPLYVVA